MHEHTRSSGAFTDHGRLEMTGRSHGPPARLRFAVKDQFDIAGVPTGRGNPAWQARSAIPARTSPPVQRLLDAGGTCVGKTHMDELGWSLNGINPHYGTPVNAAAPDRTPGGSSSGSAAAVSGGLVSFALSGDGGGSIRIPASYCGLWGIRPTVGRVTDAPDVCDRGLATAGWLASDAFTMHLVGTVLLDEFSSGAGRPTRLLYADDLFATLEPGVTDAVRQAVSQILAAADVDRPSPVTVADGHLTQWREAYKVLQGRDFHHRYGEWVKRDQPTFGPDIDRRFTWAASLTDEDDHAASQIRQEAIDRMADLLADGAILIAPSAPGIAPLRTAALSELESRRAAAFLINSPTGLTGVPQISLPLVTMHGCPLGVSLIAGRGGDEMLLAQARRIASGAVL